VAFPILDAFTGCLRRYSFLRSFQWESAALQRWQDEVVRRLVFHAYSTVPYYRERYKAEGISPSDVRTSEDLSNLPIVTKHDMKLSFPHKTISSAITSQRMKLSHTSGSTGEMFDFYADSNARGYTIASRLLFESWMGLALGDKTVRLFSFPVEWQDYGWMDWRRRVIGEVIIPISRVERDVRAGVQLIRSLRPDSVIGLVSTLSSFAKRVLDAGLEDGMNLRAVVTSAEMLLPNDRDLIARAFGSPVFDRYGLAEVAGYVAQECHVHQGLHVNNGLAVVEVVEDGQVCGPGETGHLVVTNLHNYAMPFIRYDTGDLATVGDVCPCGRAFPVLARIEGRSANWVITESAPLSWTRFLGALEAMNITSVEQYRFIQTAVGNLTLLVAPKSALASAQIDELAKRLNSIHPLVKVKVETADSIPPAASGKRILFEPLKTPNSSS
jgi:phenylacetate-CoA ligase